jgi:NTE family protein
MDFGSLPGPFSLSDNFNALVEKMSASRLRQIVRRAIPSFDKIRSGKNLKLHVNATKETDKGIENVVFSGRRLSIDKVLASSTLRGLFKPVRIDGEDYYDGAYRENPSIDPLLKRYNGGSKKNKKDKPFHAMLWIMMNPPKDDFTPRPQSAISDQELQKTSGLVLHHTYDHMALNVLQHEDLGSASVPPQHCIWFNAPGHYDQTSKQNTEAAFLLHLFEEGRKSADAFLKKHKADIAHKTTIDLDALEREGLKRAGKTIRRTPFRMRYKR